MPSRSLLSSGTKSHRRTLRTLASSDRDYLRRILAALPRPHVLRQDGLVRIVDAFEDRFPTCSDRISASSFAHGSVFHRIGQNAGDSGGKLFIAHNAAGL